MMELLIALIGATISILSSIAGLAYWLGKKFAQIDSRMERLEQRVERLEQRVERLEQRVERLEQRVERLEQRMDGFESRLDKLESSLRSLALEPTRVLIDFLWVRGVISDRDMEYLVRRLHGVMGLQLSGVSPEQLEFLRNLCAKDLKQITPEEVEKAEEIAQEWFWTEKDPKRKKIAARAMITMLYLSGYVMAKRYESWLLEARAKQQESKPF